MLFNQIKEKSTKQLSAERDSIALFYAIVELKLLNKHDIAEVIAKQWHNMELQYYDKYGASSPIDIYAGGQELDIYYKTISKEINNRIGE